MLILPSGVKDKIYDMNVPQRILFVTDDGNGNYVIITNEDVDVDGGARFMLESVNTQPIMFGCTPMSNISIDVCNAYTDPTTRRYRTSDLGDREFKAYFGIQTSDDTMVYTSKHSRTSTVIAHCRSGNLKVSVLADGTVVANMPIGSQSAITYSSILSAKIVIVFDTIYLRYEVAENVYSDYKIRKVSEEAYGAVEAADVVAVTLLQVMPEQYMSMSYNASYMEFGYPLEEIDAGYDTWQAVKADTWDIVKDSTWGELSGMLKYRAERYYCIAYGVWKTDIPRRSDTDVITLTAHDNMYKFDTDAKDFVTWIKSKRPLGTITCAEMVTYLCEYVGVKISSMSNFSNMGGGGNRNLANLIDPRIDRVFKSCKDILSYALEVGATNGLMDRNGKFKTYHSTLATDTSDVETLPFVFTTDVADFVTPAINKVLVWEWNEQKYYSYSGSGTKENVYEWSDNPFFNRASNNWWSGSDNINVLSDYRDAVVTTCANYALWSDDRYSIVIDNETCVEPIFSMNIVWNAHGTVTYTNTGCAERPAPTYEQRQTGMVNATDIHSDENYRIAIGDTTEQSSVQLTMSNSLIRLGNLLSANDKACKIFQMGDDQWLIVTRSGNIICDNGSLQFNHITGRYKFSDVLETANSANVFIDPTSGQLYRVSSLARFKDHVATIENPWEKVDNLRGVSYTSKCDGDDPTEVQYGFIAEEVQKCVPELAEYSDDLLSSVKYDRFTALLIEDCKESHRRIRELEDRLEELERRIS